MSRTMQILRIAAVVGLFGALASCDMAHDTVGPSIDGGPLFTRYVALGNSLTAGYQSGGINDSTQKAAYPVLLARAFGTRFAYPALAKPGCPPPIDTFQTQHRLTPRGFPASTSTSCYLRTPGSVTDVLNNVAVPGANVADLTSVNGTSANPLTTFVLGGLTQAGRASLAHPTFATIWIGNNDVLAPALGGLAPILPTPTTLAAFQTSYDAMLSELLTASPDLKGVLMGVVQVAAAPQLFPAAALQSPLFVGGLSLAAGTAVSPAADCLTAPGNTSKINIQIIGAIKAGTVSPTIHCVKTPSAQYPLDGDLYVLDASEQATVGALITSYNAYIQTKADAIGFAYWDPNPVLAQLATQSGAINYPPNLADYQHPFGTAFSLDGVHPSSSAHVLIANALIDVINQKYGTTVRHVQ
ncbi:MAG TPA: SGNH/GDSL hydrolase family protein [Gemmatimonadaceae bacterium]|nr:SGNH/GDSL hydrolase family protein [Gemmatimonadaceae bacterium]